MPGSERKLPWRRNPYFWAAIAGLLTIPLLRPCLRRVPSAPAPIGQLPAARLVDARGEIFDTGRLAGTVWIFGFFHTRCGNPCERLLAAMQRLRTHYRKLEVDIRLASVTTEPLHDTVERVFGFARRYAPDRAWRFVSGPATEINRVLTEGFSRHLSNEVQLRDRLAIVDSAGQLRGFFAIGKDDIAEISHRALHVMLEER